MSLFEGALIRNGRLFEFLRYQNLMYQCNRLIDYVVRIVFRIQMIDFCDKSNKFYQDLHLLIQKYFINNLNRINFLISNPFYIEEFKFNPSCTFVHTKLINWLLLVSLFGLLVHTVRRPMIIAMISKV